MIAELATAATAVLIASPKALVSETSSAPCCRTRSLPPVTLSAAPLPDRTRRFARAGTLRGARSPDRAIYLITTTRDVAVAAQHGDADVVGVVLEQQVDAPARPPAGR